MIQIQDIYRRDGSGRPVLLFMGDSSAEAEVRSGEEGHFFKHILTDLYPEL